MHHLSKKPKTKNSIFTVLIALIFFYGIGHVTPAFIPAPTSFLFSLNGPSTAYAEDEEDEEDEEEMEKKPPKGKKKERTFPILPILGRQKITSLKKYLFLD
jgi:hypothetical protein